MGTSKVGEIGDTNAHLEVLQSELEGMLSAATQRLHCLISEEKLDDDQLFSDRSIKKKTRKRKKSRLLEATQNKKLKQDAPLPTPLIVPAKSAEFWKGVSSSASTTPEASMSLLADMVAKPADLGERPKVTRS